MTGRDNYAVKLLLNTRAKNLLLEEYPLAAQDLKRIDGKWYLNTVVHKMEGIGRFVAGLAHEIKILEGEELKDYLREYAKKYMSKI